METLSQRIHLVRTEGGTLLLGPFPTEPLDNDPAVRIETGEGTFWVKHSKKSPTPEQLEMIVNCARRMVCHRNDDATSLSGSLGILSARDWKPLEDGSEIIES